MTTRKTILNDKEFDLMWGLDASVRLQIAKYLEDHEKGLVGALENYYNVIGTVLGKLFVDLLAMGAVKDNMPLEELRSVMVTLLNEELDDSYARHEKEHAKHDAT
jgi:hypothetical protein